MINKNALNQYCTTSKEVVLVSLINLGVMESNSNEESNLECYINLRGKRRALLAVTPGENVSQLYYDALFII